MKFFLYFFMFMTIACLIGSYWNIGQLFMAGICAILSLTQWLEIRQIKRQANIYKDYKKL